MVLDLCRLVGPIRPPVAQKTATLDELGHGGRRHLFPERVAAANAREHVTRVDAQALRVEIAHALDQAVLHQVCAEVPQMRCDAEVAGGDKRVRFGVEQGVGVGLQVVLEQPSEVSRIPPSRSE